MPQRKGERGGTTRGLHPRSEKVGTIPQKFKCSIQRKIKALFCFCHFLSEFNGLVDVSDRSVVSRQLIFYRDLFTEGFLKKRFERLHLGPGGRTGYRIRHCARGAATK